MLVTSNAKMIPWNYQQFQCRKQTRLENKGKMQETVKIDLSEKNTFDILIVVYDLQTICNCQGCNDFVEVFSLGKQYVCT